MEALQAGWLRLEAGQEVKQAKTAQSCFTGEKESMRAPRPGSQDSSVHAPVTLRVTATRPVLPALPLPPEGEVREEVQ